MIEDKHIKSLWERFQDQKQEPWPFVDFDEYKAWEDKQEKLREQAKERVCNYSGLLSVSEYQNIDND